MRRLILILMLLTAIPAAAQSDGRNRDIKFINYTSEVLTKLWWSRVNNNDWGPERVRGYFIPMGWERTYTVTDGTNACRFDLRAEFHNGQKAEWMNVDVCSESKWEIYD